jgi:OOP family OmpA-OmpF porin
MDDTAQRLAGARVDAGSLRTIGRVAAALCGLAALAVPGNAAAQSKTFYLDRLHWSGGPHDTIALHRPVFSEETRLFGQLGLGLSLNPLRIENHIESGEKSAILDQKSGPPVSSQLITYADFGFEVLGRAAFQLELPLILAQNGNATSGGGVGSSNVDLQSTALMDARLDARVLIHRNDARTSKLAGVGSVWFPTGAEGSFGGDRGTSGALGLSWEADVSDFFLLANSSVQWRSLASLNDLTIHHEWRWGLGVFFPMRDGEMRLGGEVFGSTGLGDGTTFSSANTPIEWMFEGRFALDDDKETYFGVGGGTRLSAGYAPDARFVALIGTSIPIEDTEPSAPARKLRVPRAASRALDADKDGLVDEMDVCPTDPEDGKPPNTDDGCPAPPDKDGDGIVDAKDKCPDQAEDFDKVDDKDGCPEDDADRDSVLDAVDACPKEPGEPSAEADKNGCPQFIRRIEGSAEIQILQQIQFATGKATILSNSFGILDEVVKLLKVSAEIEFLAIEGHTDDRGSAELNNRLSSDRANAVMEYLVQRGISPDRLSAQGFGQSRPIADNGTADGRQKNRRVEFHIRTGGAAEPAPEAPPPATEPTPEAPSP